ncbi:MAG: molybdenum cofactor guanylyltransferase [Syntrophothermus sp.]|uniref:molybdenum cofactor guanylyltransferase n=1 Tax=Syntrophothermus sp. TaxID=2736299 RepID=UPI0025804690|nr:molybdenum cofactor guanylyltransferase [Syntrophothermus sp.]NSW81951.1 molybdenum cofactor guanylyltransferase [Syntrophothermus sp.]
MLNASGVILSGGMSSRMAENKAFSRVGGKRIIDIIVAKFKDRFEEIFIVSNQPELYDDLGVKVVSDIIPGKGPLSGLHSGLSHSRAPAILAVACDMPFINLALGEWMIKLLPGYDVVAPLIGGRFQPLFAVYAKSCLPVFERCLSENKLKISRIYKEELEVRYVTEEEVALFGQAEIMFYNVNSRDNLLKAQEIAKEVIT